MAGWYQNSKALQFRAIAEFATYTMFLVNKMKTNPIDEKDHVVEAFHPSCAFSPVRFTGTKPLPDHCCRRIGHSP